MAIQPPPQNAPVMGQQEDPKKKRQGTGFANISRILEANKGAGQQIGQKIGSTLTSQAEDVRKGIDSGKAQFQAGKDAAVLQAGSKIGAAQQAVRSANESEQDYLARVAKPQEGTDFSKVGQELRSTQYTGPQQLENEEMLRGRAMGAQQLSGLAGQGAAGQDILLRNIVAGRGGYTRGQSALDRLLVGREGQASLQAGRQAGAGLTNQLQTTSNIAQKEAQAAAQNIEGQKKSIFDTVQKTLGGVEGSEGIIDRAKKAADQTNKDAMRLQQLLTTEDRDLTDLSEEDLNVLNRLRGSGLDKEIFTGDRAGMQTTLNNLAQNLITQQSAKRFQGDEQSAAANLAKLLGDQQTAKSIEENKFQEDVLNELPSNFDPSNQALSAAQSELARRTGNVGVAQNLQNLVGQLRNSMGGNIDVSRVGDLNAVFEPLEQIMPGIRARVDQDPYSVLGLDWRKYGGNNNPNINQFRKAAYLKIAEDPSTVANMQAQQAQQDQFIKSNTRSIFDTIRDKVKSKLPKKES